MIPLSRLPRSEAEGLLGVFFDLDDTVLTHGKLTAPAYEALWSLHDAGLLLVGVTGRPIAFAAMLARQWPLAGCVAENGALYAVDGKAGAIAVRDPCVESERATRRARLNALVQRVAASVPEARLASDNESRRSDVAWDIGETCELPLREIERVETQARAAGARVVRSSVHLHASFDAADKAAGALRFSENELSLSPTAALTRFAFVGDSTNDAACFGAFRTTFGVANVRASLPHLTLPPRYLADEAMGAGFVQIAKALLAMRSEREKSAGRC